jgi:hypothetical protein
MKTDTPGSCDYIIIRPVYETVIRDEYGLFRKRNKDAASPTLEQEIIRITRGYQRLKRLCNSQYIGMDEKYSG